MTTHDEAMKRLGEAVLCVGSRVDEDRDQDIVNELRSAFAALEDAESIRRARLHGMLTGLLNRVGVFKLDLRGAIRCIDGKDVDGE
jgi:hypothetical protein